MPVYAWKIFLENAIEMVSIIPSNRASEAQTFRNHHHLASSHRTQWKHLVFITESVSCIHVWRTPFSVVPIHRTVHHKNESWTDGNSLSRKIQMCSCVKFRESVVTFHWCSVYECNRWVHLVYMTTQTQVPSFWIVAFERIIEHTYVFIQLFGTIFC